MNFGEHLLVISHGFDINSRNTNPETGDLTKGLVVSSPARINWHRICDLAEFISVLSNSHVILYVPVVRDLLAVHDMYLEGGFVDKPFPELPEIIPERVQIHLSRNRRTDSNGNEIEL